MDPERELQLAEVARIKKEELKKKKLAESERNEQKIIEERLAFLEDDRKCQEEKDKELLESFKCSVCFEQFGSTYRVPVVASCSHTICYACVKRILQENQCFAEKNQFKCPRCRGQTPLGNVLKNYQLIEAMEAMKMYEDDSKNPPIHPAARGFWNGMQ
uniref:RING-type domain-containing protein n=1 Tax=Meloidogyne javanica TaxID=6303 RepID=A0A915M9S8_MELJA